MNQGKTLGPLEGRLNPNFKTDFQFEAWQFPAMPSQETGQKLERRNKTHSYNGIFGGEIKWFSFLLQTLLHLY